MEQSTNPKSFFREKKIPHFPKPKLIGYFSAGAQRNCTNGVSHLKYINKIPAGRVNFDLNHNITRALKKQEDKPCGSPNIEPPVDEGSQFHCLYEGQLNQHRLFYGAEMDGVLVEGSSLAEDLLLEELSEEQALVELRKLQFVELKTCRQIVERRHDITFRRHKTRAWWLQSFLVGVETIICGFKDDDGIVKEVQTINVHDLPKQGRDFWFPGVCMNFCDELLTYIKACFDREIVNRFGSCVNNVRRLPLLELVFERMPWSNVRLGQPFPNEEISVFDDEFISRFPKF